MALEIRPLGGLIKDNSGSVGRSNVVSRCDVVRVGRFGIQMWWCAESPFVFLVSELSGGPAQFDVVGLDRQ